MPSRRNPRGFKRVSINHRWVHVKDTDDGMSRARAESSQYHRDLVNNYRVEPNAVMDAVRNSVGVRDAPVLSREAERIINNRETVERRNSVLQGYTGEDNIRTRVDLVSERAMGLAALGKPEDLHILQQEIEYMRSANRLLEAQKSYAEAQKSVFDGKAAMENITQKYAAMPIDDAVRSMRPMGVQIDQFEELLRLGHSHEDAARIVAERTNLDAQTVKNIEAVREQIKAMAMAHHKGREVDFELTQRAASLIQVEAISDYPGQRTRLVISSPEMNPDDFRNPKMEAENLAHNITKTIHKNLSASAVELGYPSNIKGPGINSDPVAMKDVIAHTMRTHTEEGMTEKFAVGRAKGRIAKAERLGVPPPENPHAPFIVEKSPALTPSLPSESERHAEGIKGQRTMPVKAGIAGAATAAFLAVTTQGAGAKEALEEASPTFHALTHGMGENGFQYTQSTAGVVGELASYGTMAASLINGGGGALLKVGTPLMAAGSLVRGAEAYSRGDNKGIAKTITSLIGGGLGTLGGSVLGPIGSGTGGVVGYKVGDALPDVLEDLEKKHLARLKTEYSHGELTAGLTDKNNYIYKHFNETYGEEYDRRMAAMRTNNDGELPRSLPRNLRDRDTYINFHIQKMLKNQEMLDESHPSGVARVKDPSAPVDPKLRQMIEMATRSPRNNKSILYRDFPEQPDTEHYRAQLENGSSSSASSGAASAPGDAKNDKKNTAEVKPKPGEEETPEKKKEAKAPSPSASA